MKRQPAGVPVGGQFAGTARSESETPVPAEDGNVEHAVQQASDAARARFGDAARTLVVARDDERGLYLQALDEDERDLYVYGSESWRADFGGDRVLTDYEDLPEDGYDEDDDEGEAFVPTADLRLNSSISASDTDRGDEILGSWDIAHD